VNRIFLTSPQPSKSRVPSCSGGRDWERHTAGVFPAGYKYGACTMGDDFSDISWEGVR
jgi:hypothetical protein